MEFDRRRLIAGMSTLAAAAALPAPVRSAPRKFFGNGQTMIGLQLYTLGDEWVKDTDRIFADLAAIGYRDLELPGLWGKSPRALRQAADTAGVAFSAYHLPVQSLFGPAGLTIDSPAQEIADTLGLLGITNAIIPMPPIPTDGPSVPGQARVQAIAAALTGGGLDGWKRLADRLNTAATRLSPHGITLGYHNHNVEFAPVAGRTGWDVLIKETDPSLVFFELDLGWVSAAGQDPAAMIRSLGPRVRWLHVKDLKATTRKNFVLNMDPTEVGSGRQDWRAILKAASRAGVRHYYVEQEPPFAIERMEAVRKSHAFLAGLAAA